MSERSSLHPTLTDMLALTVSANSQRCTSCATDGRFIKLTLLPQIQSSFGSICMYVHAKWQATVCIFCMFCICFAAFDPRLSHNVFTNSERPTTAWGWLPQLPSPQPQLPFQLTSFYTINNSTTTAVYVAVAAGESIVCSVRFTIVRNVLPFYHQKAN